jgi:hypothetical protein
MDSIQTDSIQEVARSLEIALGSNYKVQIWTNIVFENNMIIGTFKQFNDPKHYIIAVSENSDDFIVAEIKE